MLEDGGSTVCIFLDLVKAFDSVPHSRIVQCLHEVGVRDLLSWFRDD